MVSFVQYGGIFFETGHLVIKKALLIRVIRLFYGSNIQMNVMKGINPWQ